MRLHVSHKTHYDFETPPSYGLQQVRLTPKTRPGHDVIEWSVDIEGGVIEAEFIDFNNNLTHLVRLNENAHKLSIISAGTVDVTLSDGVTGPHEGYAPLWYFNRTTPLTHPGQHILALLKKLSFDKDNAIESLHKLSAHIASHVAYEIGQTGAQTTADMAAALGRGVCQDHAHIFISCARSLGLPARYVSGYLMMDDRVDQDATHAWAEAWIKNIGWVGFDVSNQQSPNEKYIRVASGLDYAESAPISGVTFGQINESVKVELQVQQ